MFAGVFPFVFLLFGGCGVGYQSPTCRIYYVNVNMQHNYVDMKFIHVKMQHNYVDLHFTNIYHRSDFVSIDMLHVYIIHLSYNGYPFFTQSYRSYLMIGRSLYKEDG